MNLFEAHERAKDLDVKSILKDLKGEYVPVSKMQKLKLLDTNNDEFTFERDLTDKELSFFREWLLGKIQDGVREQLGI